MTEITDKFRHLYKIVSSENFLKKQSLGGEIPFFISTYDPHQENLVRDSIRLLKKKLENSGVEVLEINLYDLACTILEDRTGMERIFEVERKKSKEKFLKALQSSLNIQQVLMPKIKEMIEASNAKVYFLTGIGAAFPFIRSHTILNNLQNIAKEAPTLAFFPGEYNGHSLNLFGLLKDDNYYRAFDIDTIKA